MTFCQNCGAALPPEGAFCPNCGFARAGLGTPPVSGAPVYSPPVSAAPAYPTAPLPGVAPVIGAEPPKRGRGGLIAGIAIAAVAVLAVGAGGYVLLNNRNSGDAESSLWSQYFFPARVGYTCTYESDLDIGFGASTSTQTMRVSSVQSTSDGITINVESVTTTETDFEFPTDFPTDLFPTDFPTDFPFPSDFPFPTDFPSGIPIPTLGPDDMPELPDLSDIPPQTVEVSLSYTITDDGTLKAPPAGFSESTLKIETSDFLVYPSIEDLRGGKTLDHTVSVSAEGSGLGEIFGSDAFGLTFELHVEAAEPETITTPAGSYADVVGVTTSFGDVTFDGDIPGMEDQMSLFEGMLGSFLPETTAWYARGVGLVRTDIKAFMATTSSDLTGCTG